MKKFIVLFCMLSPLFLQAQFVESICSTIHTCDSSYKQKVRKYTKDKVIVLSKDTNDICYFYLIKDGNSVVYYIDLPNHYNITDFQILDDNVYFCGSHPDPNNVGFNIGVIGYFDINNAFGGGNIEITDISNTYYISKIKVYYNPNNLTCTNVVGIGRSSATYSNTDCFIDFNNVNNYPNWDYKILASPFPVESITDIEITDKFVVTASSSSSSIDNVYIRRYYKYDPSDYTIQTLGSFNLNTIGGTLFTALDGNYFLKRLSGENVAIVSDAGDGSSFFTYVNVLDVGSLSLTYNRMIYHVYKNLIRDLDYSEVDQNLLILTGVNDVGNSDWKDAIFYAEMDPSLSLPIFIKTVYLATYYPEYPYLNSLCIYKDYFYATIGVEPINNELFLFAKDKQQQISGSCNKYDSLKMGNSTTNLIQTIPVYFYPSSWSAAFSSYYPTPNQSTINVICIN